MKYGEIVGVSRTLRNYCGIPSEGEEDPYVRAWLDCFRPRCVIALLIDGMGSSVLKTYLKEDDFFVRHTVRNISTVFPPTTTAAVTSFATGREPCETCWLGWNQYIEEKDDNIVMFLNRSMYGNQKYGRYTWERFPAEYQHEEMQRKGIKADSVWPGWGASHPSETPEEMAENIVRLAENPQMRFLYAYWDGFDSLMHEYGPSSEKTGQELRHLQDVFEAMTERLPEDCGLLIIADHSQIDVQCIDVKADEELCGMLRKKPALEMRTVSFYVKPEFLTDFRNIFLERYGDAFDLLTHAEVMERKLFGSSKPHPDFERMIGDYLAVSRSSKNLVYGRGAVKGDHAGGLEEEAYVPLIMIPYVDSGERLI